MLAEHHRLGAGDRPQAANDAVARLEGFLGDCLESDGEATRWLALVGRRPTDRGARLGLAAALRPHLEANRALHAAVELLLPPPGTIAGTSRLVSAREGGTVNGARDGGGEAGEAAPPDAAEAPEAPAPAADRYRLPDEAPDFVGRAAELDALLAAIRPGMLPPVGAAVTGMPGVGARTLVRQAAWKLREGYPDGRLLLDASALAPGQPADAVSEALGQALRGLGVDPDVIPQRLEPRAELYQALLAERRVLVVLEHPPDHEQVRRLLPGGPGSALLVAGRSLPAALADLEHVRLEPFTHEDAIAFLTRLVGRRRVDADPAAARAVADHCGRHPLALRLVGGMMGARVNQHRPLWQLDAELSDAAAGRPGLHAAFAYRYRRLPARAALVLRRMAWLAVPGLDPAAVAALHDGDRLEAGTASALALLRDAGWLQTVPGARRWWTMHPLVSQFAADQAMEEDTDQARAAALGRVLEAALRWAGDLDAALSPGASVPGRPLTGFAAELGLRALDELDDDLAKAALRRAALDAFELRRPTLVALLARALADRLDAQVVQLASCLGRALALSGHLADWRRVADAGVEAARRAGDRSAEALHLRALGIIARRQGDPSGADEHLADALRVCEEADDKAGQAATLVEWGIAERVRGRGDQAVAMLDGALDLYRELGDQAGEAATLIELGVTERARSRGEEAVARLEAALAVERERGEPAAEAAALVELGVAERVAGRGPAAIVQLRRALAAFDELGLRAGQARALRRLGEAHLDLSEAGAAAGCVETAAGLLEQLGDRRGQAVAAEQLGTALAAAGKGDRAAAIWTGSADAFKALGDRPGEARVRERLGRLLAQRDDREGAADAYERASLLLAQLGEAAAEARVRERLGAVRELLGDFEGAADAYTRCRKLAADTGDRPGEAAALRRVGHVEGAAGRLTDAARTLAGSANLSAAAGDRAGEARTLRELAKVQGILGEPWHVAATLRRLGDTQLDLGRADEATTSLEASVAGFVEAGDGEAAATTLRHLARAELGLGRTREAIEHLTLSAKRSAELHDTVGQAEALGELAAAQLGAQRYRAAAQTFARLEKLRTELREPVKAAEALAGRVQALERAGDRLGRARELLRLGRAQAELGRPQEAEASLRACQKLFLAIDDPAGELHACQELAKVIQLGVERTGDQAALADALTRFGELSERVGVDDAAPAVDALTTARQLYAKLGRPEDELAVLELLASIQEGHGDRRGQAESLAALGAVLVEFGRGAERPASGAHLERAMTALTSSAELYHEVGEPARRADVLGRLADVHRRLGDRRGEAAALTALAELHEEGGDIDKAIAARALGVRAFQAAGDERAELQALRRLTDLEAVARAARVRNVPAAAPADPVRPDA